MTEHICTASPGFRQAASVEGNQAIEKYCGKCGISLWPSKSKILLLNVVSHNPVKSVPVCVIWLWELIPLKAVSIPQL